MKYGFIVPFATVEENLELATEIEAAGWDGYFTWDGIAAGPGIEMFDAWTLLAGVAMRTERITLGAMIFPLARRRPWVVARQALTIDHLSGGRLVIPVGLGAVEEGGFAKVHPEVTDRKQRAERLDETLEILERAWSGETFSYAGTHYQLDEIQFLPRPVQRPRIPIWTVAAWPRPKSMARAALWDGVIPSVAAPPESRPTPEQVAEISAWMREHRTSEAPFEVVLEGVSPGNDPAWEASILQPLSDAGATWWIESRWEAPNDVATLRERIRKGPPQIHARSRPA